MEEIMLNIDRCISQIQFFFQIFPIISSFHPGKISQTNIRNVTKVKQNFRYIFVSEPYRGHTFKSSMRSQSFAKSSSTNFPMLLKFATFDWIQTEAKFDPAS